MKPLVVYQDVHPIWDGDPELLFGEPDERGFVPVTNKAEVKFWVEIMIDCVPAWPRRPLRRWWCEVHARKLPDLGLTDPGHWYHYYQRDFYALSLRRAYLTAWKVADELEEDMQSDPEEQPLP